MSGAACVAFGRPTNALILGAPGQRDNPTAAPNWIASPNVIPTSSANLACSHKRHASSYTTDGNVRPHEVDNEVNAHVSGCNCLVRTCNNQTILDDSRKLVSMSENAIIEPSAPPPLFELRENPMASWKAMRTSECTFSWQTPRKLCHVSESVGTHQRTHISLMKRSRTCTRKCG